MAKVEHESFRSTKMGTRWGEIEIDKDGMAEVPDDAVDALCSGPFGFSPCGKKKKDADATVPSMEPMVMAAEERKLKRRDDDDDGEVVVRKKKKKKKSSRE